MQYTLQIKPQVYEDIFNITDYSFRFSFDKNISEKIKNKILGAIYSLEFFPNRFEIYKEKYRRTIVDGKYKIIYFVDEWTKKVIVLRVLVVKMKDSIF